LISRHVLFLCTQTAPSTIYTLSLHDALPISGAVDREKAQPCLRQPEQVPVHIAHQFAGALGGGVDRDRGVNPVRLGERERPVHADRKSTRLNSSHVAISYAVFCLKKKKTSNK